MQVSINTGPATTFGVSAQPSPVPHTDVVRMTVVQDGATIMFWDMTMEQAALISSRLSGALH